MYSTYTLQTPCSWFSLFSWIVIGQIYTYNCDVIKWKYFPRYWLFVPWNHRSPVNSPHKCQWRGVLMYSLICAWINGWGTKREAGDLRHHRARYYVIVIIFPCYSTGRRTAVRWHQHQWNNPEGYGEMNSRNPWHKFISTQQESTKSSRGWKFCWITNDFCWTGEYNGKPITTLGAPRIHRKPYGIMMIADAPVPNRHQGNNNHHVDFYWDYGAIWMALRNTHTLELECLHFDEIFITGCSGSCQNDNFQCSQWWKFRQNDIFVSVYGVAATKHTTIMRRRETTTCWLLCLYPADTLRNNYVILTL